MRDVKPCVTTLKHVPKLLRELNSSSFKKHFVDAGERCWLIKSNGRTVSARVKKYLRRVRSDAKKTYACKHQVPWYRFESAPIPRLLLHSGFMTKGPKVLVNTIGAQAVGSVYGVHFENESNSARILRKYLSEYNFERRIVAHAHTLRKVEVAQLNSVLTDWKRGSAGGRKAAG
jgi:hypothetical protein